VYDPFSKPTADSSVIIFGKGHPHRVRLAHKH
jgi:hypothetical protein